MSQTHIPRLLRSIKQEQ